MTRIDVDRLKQYENYLRKNEELFNGVKESGLLLDCKKMRKWSTARDIDTEKITASYVLSPAIISFVIWVLQNAVKKRIQRLYFLARDGYLMYQTACVLCKKLELPVECRYLYCSRYSLRIPVYHLDMEAAMDYICRGGIDVTPGKIIERSGIDRHAQENALRMLGYAQKADGIVPYAKLPEVRRKLETCGYLREQIMKKSKETMPELKRYLAQEGLLDDIESAVVDSGWVGSVQQTLNAVLRELGKEKELEGYYWGLYELPAEVNRQSYHCYYFSPRRRLRAKVYFSNCLFEAIFSAPHGMTIGYERQSGKSMPVLADFSEERKQAVERTERYLIQYAEGFAQHLTRQWRGHGEEAICAMNCQEQRRVVTKLMKKFMGNPTREEAVLYGSLRFSDDMMDDGKRQVAEPLEEAELRANHVWNKMLTMLGIRQGQLRESAWYEGSAALAGSRKKKHLRQYAMYKYLLYFRQSYLKKR